MKTTLEIQDELWSGPGEHAQEPGGLARVVEEGLRQVLSQPQLSSR